MKINIKIRCTYKNETMRCRRTDFSPIARHAAWTRPPPPATNHTEIPLGSKKSPIARHHPRFSRLSSSSSSNSSGGQWRGDAKLNHCRASSDIALRSRSTSLHSAHGSTTFAPGNPTPTINYNLLSLYPLRPSFLPRCPHLRTFLFHIPLSYYALFPSSPSLYAVTRTLSLQSRQHDNMTNNTILLI